MSNTEVRRLCASVVQNAQNETVDMEASIVSVVPQDDGTARREIIAWLNAVLFTYIMEGLDALPTRWWWEMHTRIQKLLIVSMILEGRNLRSFGVVPQHDDIPQCLVFLQHTLEERRAHFPKVREEHAFLLQKLDPVFLKLYTQ
jgi:hypothetical protein